MDFESIKAEAKRRKCRVPELFVLARSNDPFYVGTDSQKRNGQWFAEIWNKFEYEQKDDVAGRFQALSEKTESVWQAIQNELFLNAPDISSYELPEAETATENGKALYDSGRDYMEQLKFYKEFQNGQKAE